MSSDLRTHRILRGKHIMNLAAYHWSIFSLSPTDLIIKLL